MGVCPPALIIPLYKNDNLPAALQKVAALCGIDAQLLQQDFKAEPKEMQRILAANRRKPDVKQVFLLGLGNPKSLSDITDAFRSFSFRLKTKLPDTIGIDLLIANIDRKNETVNALTEAAANGLLLGTYDIGLYKTDEKKLHPLNSTNATVQFYAPAQFAQIITKATQKGTAIAQTQLRIFDLVNSSSAIVTPEKIGEWATESGKENGFKVTVFHKAQIEEMGMNALLAVNRGSELPPTFTVMEYLPQQLPANTTLPKIGLIGKGVTFDTGGLNIKLMSMQFMRSDMGGAAAVLGAMELAAKLQLPVHLIGVIPATDNCVDAKSIKPGDVIGSYSGKTIEVDNTDAEGRLILADGICYLNRTYQPDVMIDLATLTGSCFTTFGSKVAGLFSNNDALARQIYQQGLKTGELVWQMPIWDIYGKMIQSDIADIKNNHQPPVAGAIAAAKFLEFFTEKHPAWAHLDIAGTAFGDSEYSATKSGTAFGVRLLVAYLENFGK